MIKSLVIRSYPARYILSSKSWRASGVESHSVDGPSESVVNLCTKSLTCESAIPTSSMKDFPLIPYISHEVIVKMPSGDGDFPHFARIQLMSSPENTKEKHAKTNPKNSGEIKWKQHRIITLWSTKVSCQACVVHSRSQKHLPLASMWAAIHLVKPSSNSVGPSNGCHLHSLESQVPKFQSAAISGFERKWMNGMNGMNADQNPLDLRCDLILDDFGISNIKMWDGSREEPFKTHKAEAQIWVQSLVVRWWPCQWESQPSIYFHRALVSWQVMWII